MFNHPNVGGSRNNNFLDREGGFSQMMNPWQMLNPWMNQNPFQQFQNQWNMGTNQGYGRKNRKRQRKGNKSIEFSILGSNANGIQAKQESLLGNINVFHPSVITLQETKLRKTGLLSI